MHINIYITYRRGSRTRGNNLSKQRRSIFTATIMRYYNFVATYVQYMDTSNSFTNHLNEYMCAREKIIQIYTHVYITLKNFYFFIFLFNTKITYLVRFVYFNIRIVINKFSCQAPRSRSYEMSPAAMSYIISTIERVRRYR